jgi:hypothetical protein
VANEHIPAPSPILCGACPGEVQEDPGDGAQSLAINLAGAASIPTELELKAVHLRVGDQFWEPRTPVDLEELAHGGAQWIKFEGFERQDESVSLLLSLSFRDCPEGSDCEFWASTPILVLKPK